MTVKAGEVPELAAVLRAHRAAAQLTQEELAERAGISTRAVSDIERGLRRLIYRDTARRLAAGLMLDERDSAAFLAAARGRRPTEPQDELLSGSVPIPPTRLIGRGAALAGLIELLTRSDVRLVTLIGPGGIGKTRLAIEAAHQLASTPLGDVLFVSLGDIRDPELVVPTIAGVMRIRAPRGPLVPAIAARLRSKDTLLFLDTCEHVLAAAPAVAEILSLAPTLRIVATSRRPLNLRGEFQVPVEPLREDAMTLFVERALAVKPELELDAAFHRTITEICERLEGIPLAIELAAIRVRHFAPAEILAHLQSRLPILTEGPVDLPARQRAMADTVAWSYDLLGSQERRLLQELSVFAGGWSSESVRPVCTEDWAGEQVIPLGALIDSSLVRRDGIAVPPRYRLLDVVRDYAADKLIDRVSAEGVGDLKRRHAEHFLAIAETAEPHLRSVDHRTWVSRLAAEHDNLRAALSWAIENANADVALRLTASLWMFWRSAGVFSEGRAWMEQALRLDAAGCESIRASTLWGAGWLGYQVGDYQGAAEFGDELLSWARKAGGPEQVRNGVTLVGMGRLAVADYRGAAALFKEALAIARSLDSRWLLATSLLNRAVAALHMQDLSKARLLLAESHALYEDLGDDRFSARAALQIAYVSLLEGDTRMAGDLMTTSLSMFRDLGDPMGIAEELGGLSAVGAALGDWMRAAKLAGAAESAWDEIAARPHPADVASNERWLIRARTRGNASEWNRAYDEGRAMESGAAIAFALDES